MTPIINPQNNENTSEFSFFDCVGQIEFVSITTMIITSADNANTYPSIGETHDPVMDKTITASVPISDLAWGFATP